MRFAGSVPPGDRCPRAHGAVPPARDGAGGGLVLGWVLPRSAGLWVLGEAAPPAVKQEVLLRFCAPLGWVPRELHAEGRRAIAAPAVGQPGCGAVWGRLCLRVGPAAREGGLFPVLCLLLEQGETSLAGDVWPSLDCRAAPGQQAPRSASAWELDLVPDLMGQLRTSFFPNGVAEGRRRRRQQGDEAREIWPWGGSLPLGWWLRGAVGGCSCRSCHHVVNTPRLGQPKRLF